MMHDKRFCTLISAMRSQSTKPVNRALVLLITLSAFGLTQAIVKQQSQQQGQMASNANSQQQARSEDQSGSSSLLISSSSGPSASSSQSSSASGSSFQPPGSQSASNSVGGAQFSPFNPSAGSSSSSSSSSNSGSPNSVSNSFVGLSSGSQSTLSSSAASASSSSSPTKQQAMYYDGIQSSASDQSYQAAASMVNAALANYANSQSAPQQQASMSANSQNQQNNNMQYSPVHYLYYPGSKDSSGSSSKQDPMSASASGYQPYSTYADQLAAISSGNVGQQSSADSMVQASNQDPSYLPQPNSNQNNMMQQDSLFQPQQQQSQQYNSQNGLADLGAYANQLTPTHVSSQQPSIGGSQQQQQHQPSHNSQQQSPQHGSVQFQSTQAQQNLANNNQNQDPFNLNSYQNPMNQVNLQASASQHQQTNNVNQQQQSQPNGFFNQMGDLYTSNFGTAALSAPVASYMSPNQNTNNQLSSNNGLIQDPFGQQAQQQHPQLHHQASNSFSNQGVANGASQASSSVGNILNNPYLNSLFQSPQFARQYAAATAAANGQVAPNGDNAGMMASGSQPSSAIAASGSSKKFGISSFIMPMLALAGLSLLIPTMSNIGTAVGRKKRSIGEEKGSLIERQQQILYESMSGLANQLAKESAIGEYLERIDRYYNLYRNAAENDDCMNKLICEFGDSVKNVSGKNAVITIMEKLVPNWMVGKLSLFKEAAMDAKEGREKCQKYSCHHDKHFNNSHKKLKPSN